MPGRLLAPTDVLADQGQPVAFTTRASGALPGGDTFAPTATLAEGAAKAFDNLASTKWLDFAPDPATRASFLDHA